MGPEDSNHHVFYRAKERKHYFVGFTSAPIQVRWSLQKKRAFQFPTLQTAEWFIWKHQPTTEVKLEIEKEEPCT